MASPPPRRRLMGIDDRRDDVGPVARHDDEAARPDPLEHVLGLHRPDRDAADDLVEVRPGMERLALDALEDHREGRVGQDGPVWQHAEQRDPVSGETLLEGPRETGFGVEVHLVHDRPGDLDAVAFEQGGVQDDLVDRPADPALGHDDRGRAEHRGDDRVREPDDRPDPRVAGPLDEQDVAVGGERRVGVADPLRQVLHDPALDVGLGEPARDVDRAHPRDRLGEVEHALHEDGVLVGRHAFLDDRPLPDRLHESGRQPTAFEAVHDPEADRGLAPVLAGRGEVDVAHRSGPCVVGVSRGWRSCARSGRRHRAGATASPRRRPRARGTGPGAPSRPR